MSGKARVQMCTRHHDPKAIGTNQPHSMYTRRAVCGVRKRSYAMFKAGTDNDRAHSTPASGLGDNSGNRLRWRGDDDECVGLRADRHVLARRHRHGASHQSRDTGN
jgi:hypothetical protein